ncbi:hypothetical protein AX14_002285 [Amanita brunnescens Koide BX004]|nr:hypothetical protein AX14_002285 [Amanita brunnescens Koide BX004]
MVQLRIQSVQTEYYVISDGSETNGSIVETVSKNEYNPDTTVLQIEPPVTSSPAFVVATMLGKADLFIGYKEVDGKLFLSWTDRPCMWVISSTEPGTFNIRIADGQDPYWFDKFNVGIDNRVALMPRQDAKEQENSFRISDSN